MSSIKISLALEFQTSASNTEKNNPDRSDSGAASAILYYQYNRSKHGGQMFASKEAFQEVATSPGSSEAAYVVSQSPELLRYVRDHSEQLAQIQESTQQSPSGAGAACFVTNAISCSNKGFAHRNNIKQELEATMEQRNLRLCCFACGLVICFSGCSCCGRFREWCDAEEMELSEDSYCRILGERFPDETQTTVVYEFDSK